MKSPNTPYVIVVGIDYSEVSHLALCHAFQAACERTKAKIHVLHVQTDVDGCAPADPDLESAAEDVLGWALDDLQGFVRKVFASFQEAQRRPETELFEPISHVRCNAPAEEIAQLASDLRADLVVVGTRGGAGEARLGSAAHVVVRLAPCPVLVVREKQKHWPRMANSTPPAVRFVETRTHAAGTERSRKQHVKHRARHRGDVVGSEANFPRAR